MIGGISPLNVRRRYNGEHFILQSVDVSVLTCKGEETLVSEDKVHLCFQAPVPILLFKRGGVCLNGLCPFFCRNLIRKKGRFNRLSRDRKWFFPCKCVAGHGSRCEGQSLQIEASASQTISEKLRKL